VTDAAIEKKMYNYDLVTSAFSKYFNSD
jgi:hypothetical protein